MCLRKLEVDFKGNAVKSKQRHSVQKSNPPFPVYIGGII